MVWLLLVMSLLSLKQLVKVGLHPDRAVVIEGLRRGVERGGEKGRQRLLPTAGGWRTARRPTWPRAHRHGVDGRALARQDNPSVGIVRPATAAKA